MRRALEEYEVRGIRTSVPFFRWLVRQTEFAAAQFHTAWLDELLHTRAGTPFYTASASVEEVAALAVAIAQAERAVSGAAMRSVAADHMRRPEPDASVPAETGSGEHWRRRARAENLRL